MRGLDHAETYLATRSSGYLISDSVTLADFVLAAMVHGPSFTVLGTAERAKYPNVFTHYARVTEAEKVKQFWGTEGFTEVAIKEPKTLTR